MDYRRLGHSGLWVSAVGIGCNNFGAKCDEAATRAVVHACLDAGITLFDTADMYGNRGGSETLLGRILGHHRKDIVLASKFGLPMGEGPYLNGAGRHYIMRAVEDSLRRLRTDHLDLYQVHRPDPATPIEETLRALDDLVRDGKVRYVGCSNFAGWQLAEAEWAARAGGTVRFISAQNEYSLVDRRIEGELVPAANAYGVGILPYFPLANGLLTGKYQRNHAMPDGARMTERPTRAEEVLTDRNWTIAEKVADYAAARGHSLLEAAIGWLASQDHVPSVIAGATTAEQVAQNAAAADWRMTAEEIADINALSDL
ncbi:MAG: aldo/keto reductase [Pseudomonadota bacterium]|nr:aldo/keto reductase [Nisaea sp.]MEC8083030.1 aldo/keto reductase [Pseudomonadota bacterium]MEC8583724.1 aldo/keto reductase [Pseudomonadota bacterium]MEC8677049.1 aldo/keto reductase [Pseudomonadota bacterium]MEC9174970.1 aldo/keto reductase [Pseudomonadota bacterium]